MQSWHGCKAMPRWSSRFLHFAVRSLAARRIGVPRYCPCSVAPLQ